MDAATFSPCAAAERLTTLRADFAEKLEHHNDEVVSFGVCPCDEREGEKVLNSELFSGEFEVYFNASWPACCLIPGEAGLYVLISVLSR